MELIKKVNEKYWLLPIASTFLIMFGTKLPPLSYLAFLIVAAAVFILDTEKMLCLMVFILPMANAFKWAPDSQSFFTYLLLIFVLYKVLTVSAVSRAVIIFCVYVALSEIIFENIDINKTIKLLAGLMLINYVASDDSIEDYETIMVYYTIGVIVASTIAYLNTIADLSFMRIDDYITTKELGIAYGFGELSRFSGLDTDPNYYSVNVIISICFIVIRLHKGTIHIAVALTELAALLFFSILTYSKSVLIMLAFPAVLFMYSKRKKNDIVAQLLGVILLIAVVVYVFSGHIDALNVVMSRFSKATGNSTLDVLTTGRITIWQGYMNYFYENPLAFMIGSGVGAGPVNGKIIHNAYIDMVYFLGFFGTAIFMYALIESANSRAIRFKRSLLNYGVIVPVMIMYLFLSELFYYDAPFHIMLGILVMNMDMEKESLQPEQYRIKTLTFKR